MTRGAEIEQCPLNGTFQGRGKFSPGMFPPEGLQLSYHRVKEVKDSDHIFKRMATGNEREFVQAQTEGFLKNPALRIQLNWILYF